MFFTLIDKPFWPQGNLSAFLVGGFLRKGGVCLRPILNRWSSTKREKRVLFSIDRSSSVVEHADFHCFDSLLPFARVQETFDRLDRYVFHAD